MRRLTLLVVCLLSLCLGLLGSPGSGAAVAEPAPASSQGPDPYWPLDGNAGTDALHYDVRVAYDFDRKALKGTTTVTMLATADLRSFSLDLLLTPTSVRVDGRRARFKKSGRHELRVVPARPVAAGTRFKVRVAYEGRPGRLGYAGERNWLADADEVVTMNQPHMAPWWFPSNDHPTDKATFDIRVKVPRKATVISNGTRVGRVVAGTRATTHWRVREPMATYLAYFAAGDFAVTTGRSPAGIKYYNAVSRGIPAAGRRVAQRTLAESAAITDWLAQHFGPYPFSSTGGLVTSLPVGFALENQTRPTYGSWIDRSVVVHELAHQWFGDSLAVRRWRDIWLNEGFATYAEALYRSEHGGPSIESWVQTSFAASCSRATSRFWTLRLDDPGKDLIFDEAVYERGALVLGALRSRLGAPAFDALLRDWASTHRGGNVDVPQFEAFAEARTGQELTSFFDAWLRGGRPPAGTAEFGLTRGCP